MTHVHIPSWSHRVSRVLRGFRGQDVIELLANLAWLG
jgi:hypothetical protein